MFFSRGAKPPGSLQDRGSLPLMAAASYGTCQSASARFMRAALIHQTIRLRSFIKIVIRIGVSRGLGAE